MWRIWIELERRPEYDEGDALAYWWAWGHLGQDASCEARTVDELILRWPSGSVTGPSDDPDRPTGDTTARCLLAAHIRQTGEVPERLRYVTPDVREPAPAPRPTPTVRRRSEAGPGLGLGTLGERARRPSG